MMATHKTTPSCVGLFRLLEGKELQNNLLAEFLLMLFLISEIPLWSSQFHFSKQHKETERNPLFKRLSFSQTMIVQPLMVGPSSILLYAILPSSIFILLAIGLLIIVSAVSINDLGLRDKSKFSKKRKKLTQIEARCPLIHS